MNDFSNKQISQQVDTLSEGLINEFLNHTEECQRLNPEMTDSNVIFRSWAIQKIAGLHGLALDLAKPVSELEHENFHH